jgi:hypothetical protein
MLPEDVKQFLAENIANVEVIGEIRETLGLTTAEVNGDTVRAFLETSEGIAIAQPYIDRGITAVIDSWKANSLPKLVQAEYAKRHPAEDERDKRLREMEDKLSRMEYEKTRESLKSSALQTLMTKGLPTELVSFVVADDSEQTEGNLAAITQIWTDKLNAAVTSQVEERFKKAGGGQPPKTSGNGQGVINPWRKETFNLTRQGEITQTDPEQAKSLKAEAAQAAK